MQIKSCLGVMLSTFVLPLSLAAVWQPTDMSPVLPAGNHQRKAVIFPQLEYHMAYNATNGEHNLDEMLFGQTVHIRDISLASRLANQQKLATVGDPATAEANDEYLGTMADAEVAFNTKQQVARLGLNGSMRLNENLCEGPQWSVGFSIPFEYYEHGMDVNITEGSAGTLATSGAGRFGNVQNITLFAVDHGDLDAYWRNDILQLKGLQKTDTRRNIGIGSVRLSSTLHAKKGSLGNFYVSALVGLPTGSKSNGNIVWPIERGASNSWQIGFSGAWNCKLNDRWSFFSQSSFMKSFSMNVNLRVPKLNTSTQGTSLFAAGILANVRFTGTAGTATTDLVLKETISEYDSAMPYFANNAINVKRRLGWIVNSKGGFKYDAGPFDLKFWYDFYFRRKTKVRANNNTPDGTYNYATVTARTEQVRHTLGWMTEYPLGMDSKIGIGSSHVFTGKNTPKYHSMYLNFSSCF